jgi:hypothetical protein
LLLRLCLSEDEKLRMQIQIQISNGFHLKSSHSISLNAFAGRIKTRDMRVTPRFHDIPTSFLKTGQIVAGRMQPERADYHKFALLRQEIC